MSHKVFPRKEYKVIVIGESGVGKTYLIRRCTQRFFIGDDAYASKKSEVSIRCVTPHNLRVQLNIWDTAGQERFRTLTRSFYRECHAAIFVYDVSKKDSFENLSFWLQEIKRQAYPVVKYLIGNEIQLDRQVDNREAAEFSHKNHFDYFLETSALTGKHIDNLFQDIAERLVDKDKQGRIFVLNPPDIIRPAKGDGRVRNRLHVVWNVHRPPKKSEEMHRTGQFKSLVSKIPSASQIYYYLKLTETKPPKQYKVTFVGDCCVGKTFLIKQFLQGSIPGQICKATKRSNLFFKSMKLGDTNVNLLIFDTAGDSNYKDCARNSYPGSHAVVFVYDISRRTSFVNLSWWMKDVCRLSNPVLKYLVGNVTSPAKERRLDSSKVDTIADTEGYNNFVETCPTTGKNVKYLFLDIVERLLKMGE